jgi:4-aminobutyrate aminotransferase-like enzyme
MTNAEKSTDLTYESQSGVLSPDIQKYTDALFSAILMEQKQFNQIRPADPTKIESFKAQLAKYIKARGREFFYQYLSSGRGHGPFTELKDGSVKYDMIGGIGFNLLGHSHPIYIRSCLEAATVDTVMVGHLQTYQETNELTLHILEAVKKSRLKHFWFACSGSFANDIALKLIWQKKNPQYAIFAFKKAFAGRSVATQDITDKAEYREGMQKTLDVTHISHFDQNHPEQSLANTLKELNEAWNQRPNAYGAIMIELVQGEGGFIFGTKEYYEGVFQWAKSKNLYIWVDEVQSFGRTHELFAFQTFGLDQYVDVVTVAKAFQNCGVLYTEELNPKPGLIAGTFASSITSLKAGNHILKFLLEGGFYGPNGRNAQIEQKMKTMLNELKSHSCKGKITYVGGIGTMISFEVGDSSNDITNKFVKKLFDNGVMCFTAGKYPTRVRFLVPLTLTDHHIQEIAQIIEKTVLEIIS